MRGPRSPTSSKKISSSAPLWGQEVKTPYNCRLWEIDPTALASMGKTLSVQVPTGFVIVLDGQSPEELLEAELQDLLLYFHDGLPASVTTAPKLILVAFDAASTLPWCSKALRRFPEFDALNNVLLFDSTQPKLFVKALRQHMEVHPKHPGTAMTRPFLAWLRSQRETQRLPVLEDTSTWLSDIRSQLQMSELPMDTFSQLLSEVLRYEQADRCPRH